MFRAWNFFTLEKVYGSLHCAPETEQSAILNLEQARPFLSGGGLCSTSRMWMPFGFIYERGFDPQIPRDAPLGERYFRVSDPDEHELSFAQPLQRHPARA